MKQKTLALLLILSLTLSFAACGTQGTKTGEGSKGSDENSSGKTNNAEKSKKGGTKPTGRVTNVTSPEFKLTDGFIVPVEKQTTVPEGWIGISTAEEFDKVRMNPIGKYILMNDLDLSSLKNYESTNLDEGGIFDGNACKISGFTTTLFHSVSGAMIKNLGVVCSVRGFLQGYKNQQLL